MRYFIFVFCFIVSCSKIELEITGIGHKQDLTGNEILENKNESLFSKLIYSTDGNLLKQYNYDTPAKDGLLTIYKYDSLLNLVRQEEYSNGQLIKYKNYNEYGIELEVTILEERNTSEKISITNYYSENKLLSKRLIIDTHYKDKVFSKSDSVEYYFLYNRQQDTLFIRQRTNKTDSSSSTRFNYKESNSYRIFNSNNKIIEGSSIPKEISDYYFCSYDSLNRIISYSNSTNKWVYTYNDYNMIASMELYLKNELQYKIVYTYSNLNLLKNNISNFSNKLITNDPNEYTQK